jgi:carboxyl-terminal processing protease
MLRLTTARYYTPTGRSIQKPYKDGVDKYHKELEERFKHGELINKDSIHFPDSLKYQTLRLKRTVYGGGGIMPDIFIPLDTTRYTDFHRKTVARGIINKIVVQYIDENRSALKNDYPTFENFEKKFQIPESEISKLKMQADKEKITYTDEILKKSLPLINLQLKALIARDIWSMTEYYRIMDGENEALQKAIEILSKNSAYDKILN